MSHTKGPWFVSPQGYFVRYHIPGFANCNICDVDCGAPLEEREANAHLIAAAPELLETLDAARALISSAYNHVSHGGPTREEAAAMVRRCEALIAKAEGFAKAEAQ